jgi:hypothetical protein
MSTIRYKSPDYFLLDELLTDEHKLIRGAIRDWVNGAVMPIIDEANLKHEFPVHLVKELGGISEDEYELLERAFELARLKQKYAVPYSVALYNLQKKNAFAEGCKNERLSRETGETFNPAKNPYIATSLLRLLNIGGQNPPLNLSVQGKLPGWENNYDKLYDL